MRSLSLTVGEFYNLSYIAVIVKKTTQSRSKPPSDTEIKRARMAQCIRALPKGRVSTYGAIARAAGWQGAARQVVRVLRQVPGLPWQRVVGSGGAIKLPGEQAAEQRFRLRMEGVTFRGARVNMKLHEHRFAKVRSSKR
jgi:methylated-DNA-protein-cysteine methyltransferase related protein